MLLYIYTYANALPEQSKILSDQMIGSFFAFEGTNMRPVRPLLVP